MDNTDVVLTLSNLSFLLAQCTELKAGEPFEVIARFSIIDACFELEDTLDNVHDLVETPLEGIT